MIRSNKIKTPGTLSLISRKEDDLGNSWIYTEYNQIRRGDCYIIGRSCEGDVYGYNYRIPLSYPC